MKAACGVGVYAALLDAAPGSGFDADGKSVRGFELVESNRLAADEIIALVPEAFSLVVRAPETPGGAPFAASVAVDGGFAARVIRDYQSSVAADRSLVSALVGAQAMPLAVDNEAGVVTLVANGGCVRVLTAS